MNKRFLPIILAAAVAVCCMTSCGSDISRKDSARVETVTSATVQTSAAYPIVSPSIPIETTVTTVTTVPTTPAQTATAAAGNVNPAVPYTSANALYCVEDAKFISARDINKGISIASTTKMMTAMLVVKHLAQDAQITVGTEVGMIKPDSTVAGFFAGQRITVKQLLYGLMLPSGNDAAYVAAVNVARSVDPANSVTDAQAVSVFVKMMNDYAAELGMKMTHFANPEGWDDPQHYSTLYDMMILARYALQRPMIAEVVSQYYVETQPLSGGYMAWTNTNRLLDPKSAYYVSDAIGIKTGTTANAGCCLIAAVKRNGKTYICAVMGCQTDDDRYKAARSLLQLI